jgi:hypothetical protein
VIDRVNATSCHGWRCDSFLDGTNPDYPDWTLERNAQCVMCDEATGPECVSRPLLHKGDGMGNTLVDSTVEEETYRTHQAPIKVRVWGLEIPGLGVWIPV